MPNSPEWPIVPETKIGGHQVIVAVDVYAPRKRPPNPSRFKFEKVNEVTLKLTNGERDFTPASLGQWAGYQTTKALAWVICLHPGEWLARCGDQACGPESLSLAKADAVAMAKGTPGCFVIADPVPHLDGTQAILADRASRND